MFNVDSQMKYREIQETLNLNALAFRLTLKNHLQTSLFSGSYIA